MPTNKDVETHYAADMAPNGRQWATLCGRWVVKSELVRTSEPTCQRCRELQQEHDDLHI